MTTNASTTPSFEERRETSPDVGSGHSATPVSVPDNVHLSDFTAVRYRNISGLVVKELSRFNLVTGRNNVGKSSLLEAMWLFTGRYNTPLVWNPHVQRTTNPDADPLRFLSGSSVELQGIEGGEFHRVRYEYESMTSVSGFLAPEGSREDTIRHLPITGRLLTWLDDVPVKGDMEGMHRTPQGLVLYRMPMTDNQIKDRPPSVIESTHYHRIFSGDQLEQFSKFIIESSKDQLLECLKLLSPEIRDANIVTDPHPPPRLLFTLENNRKVMLQDLGGGSVRLFRLLLGIFASRNGIFLVDEIESGLHFTIQREMLTMLDRWMKQWNVQLIATTHNDELVDAVTDVYGDGLEDISVQRLYIHDRTEKVGSFTIADEILEGALDLNADLR